VRALRRFTVRAQLPAALAPLGDLVLNLRWSWHPQTRDLFADVDPEVWQTSGGDPVKLLGEVSRERLDELAADRTFLDRLTEAARDLHEYLTADRWYQSLEGDRPSAIAYFSPEFGVTEVLPQYSGGLGILAGDHLKAASDLGVPIVGVGLLYRAGYFVQSLSRDGWQLERYPGVDPHGLPLTPLTDSDGSPLKITIGLPGQRTLTALVWKAQIGRVPLLLLDSDVEDNDPEVRAVTDRLYGGGTDHRLHQEMLLGIGGVRALRAFSRVTGAPQPEVYHTNEGHAGFLGLERIREYVVAGLNFHEALAATRAATLFTTHTPVPAGIDRFPRDMIVRAFGAGNAMPGMPVERILALGAEPPGGDPNVFNMACMGLRLAQRANGVSKLHGAVSQEMFAGLWPGFDSSEVPIGSVTNGVHAPTWVSREVMELAAARLPSIIEDPHRFDAIDRLSEETVWRTRRRLRERLVAEVRRRLRVSWQQRGAIPAELGWIDNVFDPDVLTIGFARRVPSYKRLTLMLRDRARLTALLLHEERPIQIVIAGKSHPADDFGKQLVQQMVQFADSADVRHRMAYLPDYDMGMARFLMSGCDVWLNNPLRPLEACGTSGMKAALNGALNLSIRDGWWDEMYDGQNGYAIPTADGVGDPNRRDDLEAAALYELLEHTITPRFYEQGKGASKPPGRWVAMVKHDLISLGPKVLASRMVRDYVEELYWPAAVSGRNVTGDDCAGARELAAWRQRVTKAWPFVKITQVDATAQTEVPQVGTNLAVRATVELGGLTPDDVDVQAAYGRVDDSDEIAELDSSSLAPVEQPGYEGGPLRYAGTVALDRAGAFGWTVRVLPRHRLLASSAELGLVVTA
jgi:starch phosphorylase